MVAKAKKLEINRNRLRSKKQAIKEAKKISQKGEEREKEVLVYIYFIRG